MSQFQYEYNAYKHASTGLAPYEIDIGRVPANPVMRSRASCRVQCQRASDATQRKEGYNKLAWDSLANYKARQKYHAAKHRRDVQHNVGDLVLLLADTFEVRCRANLENEWQPKYFGSLLVREAVGPVTHRIELPPSMRRAHEVFHVSKLKQYHCPSRKTGPLHFVIHADGNEKNAVSAILDKNTHESQSLLPRPVLWRLRNGRGLDPQVGVFQLQRANTKL